MLILAALDVHMGVAIQQQLGGTACGMLSHTLLFAGPGQTEDDLDRHVLLAAERTADLAVDDAHPLGGQTERVGDLFPVFEEQENTSANGDSSSASSNQYS